MPFVNVSEAARELGARPQDISELFYKRRLRDDLAPIVGGRRLIDRTLLPVIRMQLKRAGKTVAREVLAHA
jgi:hypothetical protein